jgi:hypothetical protein
LTSPGNVTIVILAETTAGTRAVAAALIARRSVPAK